MRNFKPEHLARNKSICVEVLNGATLKVTSEKHGVSRERIRQILYRMLVIIDIDMWKASMQSRKSCNTQYLRDRKDQIIPLIKAL